MSTEKFVFTVEMDEDDDRHILIPLAGLSFEYKDAFDVPYDWNIDWGDGIIQRYTGINSVDELIGYIYNEPGKYTVTITPIKDDFGWMRAWGNPVEKFTFKSNGDVHCIWAPDNPKNCKKKLDMIISFDYVTNKSFMQSETSYGHNYMRGIFAYCSGLTKPANIIKTVSEDKITDTGHNFLSYQYFFCQNLHIPDIEKLHRSIEKVGNHFLAYQYGVCSNLKDAATEGLHDNIISIGNDYRTGQYSCCASLTKTAEEVVPQYIQTIGDAYRTTQYDTCVNLLTVANEVDIPETCNVNENYFRRNQYRNSINLNKLPEFSKTNRKKKHRHVREFRDCQFDLDIGVMPLEFKGLENSEKASRRMNIEHANKWIDKLIAWERKPKKEKQEYVQNLRGNLHKKHKWRDSINTTSEADLED